MTWSAARFVFPLSTVSALLLTAACGTQGLGVSSQSNGLTSDGSADAGLADGAHPRRDGSTDSTVSPDVGRLTQNDTGLGDSEAGHRPIGICVPRTCIELGANCGPMGDGCGGLLQCGNCTAPQTCGGGDAGSVCGGGGCTPVTCDYWHATCGPVGDGCGHLLQCGACTSPDGGATTQTCGGGGTASQCGGDAGCVPKNCAQLGFNCGPAGDGCGNLISSCGNCVSPQTCGGGGVHGMCGASDAGTAGDAGVQADAGCVPDTCVSLGFNCGPAGDGCGHLLQCGSCTSPEICGGGIAGAAPDAGGPVPGRCGGGTICQKQTCAQLGISCGPAGDGCGDVLQCGTCTPPATCGGGIVGAAPDAGGPVPGVCGGSNACVPRTCAQLGFNCGPAGDGCGNLISSCGTCTAPEICGGGVGDAGAGGKPGVCGPADAGAATCTGLCLSQTTCPTPGVTTAITGTVYAPNGTDPLYNALVYIPNNSSDPGLGPFADGAMCLPCTADVAGSPLVSTTSASDGTFELDNIPAGVSFPLVIQLGRWRRQVTVSAINACTNVNISTNPPGPASACSAATAASATATTGCLTSLPTNHTQGDIPFTAIVTGNVDALECVFLKMGLAQSEFGNPQTTFGTTAGSTPPNLPRIQLYKGDTHPGATISGATPSETALWGGATPPINIYDMVVLSCQGSPVAANTAESMIDFANIGGRVFATHYNYTWLNTNPAGYTNPFTASANWVGEDDNFASDPGTGIINTGFTEGQALSQWLQFIGASTAYGQIGVNTLRGNFSGIVPPSQLWIHVNDATMGNWPLHYSFYTPYVANAAAGQCGRVVYEDYHVENAVTGGLTFPNECNTSKGTACAGQCTEQCAYDGYTTNSCMTPQEKLLEFEMFDLASCINSVTPPTTGCTKTTCAAQGIKCGPAGDGCGGVLQCGPCTPPETCGGGGVPGQCGGTPCTPITCLSQGIQCGPAGDGCGDLIQCGVCPNGETCGGGGVPGVCGKPACDTSTCALQGLQCGPTGDGCGGLLECGFCAAGQTCGGCGVTGQCVWPCGADGGTTTNTCVPLTCQEQGIECGPAGDGCGNLIPNGCGNCQPPQYCGGGGSGKCGGTSCVPTTCSALGYNCGPAGDGCGNVLQCGTCPANQTCGGCGQPGVCCSTCKPTTCAALGCNCGPAGDGCGGLLECGTCPADGGLTCGGGGTPCRCGFYSPP